ncbi:MAG: 3-hydroxybutyrate dehydrogenase [Saprospiraceae bacterium]|nr:3-hydroxybutyrate dehydrogenase [Saprospiraceae bacterium]
MSIKDYVVLITGAASGIGLEMAEKFARNEARVVISDVDERKLDKAIISLGEKNLNVQSHTCDVALAKDIDHSVSQVYEEFGRIDVLINNAGLQYISPMEEFPDEKFELLIRVMLTGSFLMTKRVFPIMKRQRFGRIINMASINGLVGFAGKAAYNSAKHGIIGLTKVTALEGAEYEITANALCPGYVDTPLVRNQLAALAESRNVPLEEVIDQVIFPLVPIKRLLSPEEVASYALFLASAEAGGITGQAVVIDGGYTAH